MSIKEIANKVVCTTATVYKYRRQWLLLTEGQRDLQDARTKRQRARDLQRVRTKRQRARDLQRVRTKRQRARDLCLQRERRERKRERRERKRERQRKHAEQELERAKVNDERKRLVLMPRQKSAWFSLCAPDHESVFRKNIDKTTGCPTNDKCFVCNERARWEYHPRLGLVFKKREVNSVRNLRAQTVLATIRRLAWRKFGASVLVTRVLKEFSAPQRHEAEAALEMLAKAGCVDVAAQHVREIVRVTPGKRS